MRRFRLFSRHLPVVALFISTSAPFMFAGIYYRTTMTRASGTATVDAWSDGKNVKFQVVQSDDPSMPSSFGIIADDTGTMKVESPNGNCMQMSHDQYVALNRKRYGVKLVGDVKVEKVLEEDGGVIAGNRTRHYRMKLSARFDEGNGQAPRLFVIEEDLWAAASVPQAPTLLNMMFTQTLGIEQVDKALEFADIKGFRFKRVVVITADGNLLGQSTVEVNDYREQSIAPSVFKADMPCSVLQQRH